MKSVITTYNMGIKTLLSEIESQTQELKTLLKKPTFEEYLHVEFMRSAPEEVGDKDSFEDNFNNWLEYQGADMLIQYAEAWGKTLN